MELTLKRLLEHAEFKKYRGKGYDPTEVDDFLDRAAAMASKVEVQLTQALEQAKAGGSAPQPQVDIEAEVERRLAERVASAPSIPSEDETAEQVRRTIVMAQRTSDAAIAEAREDAAKIVAAASAQAETLVADAEARSATLRAETDEYVDTTRAEVDAEAASERREARQRLAAEIAELEGSRESLRSDVNVLERHVEEQRSQLGSTLAELQLILDDPSGFRLAPAPALVDPVLPDFSDLDDAPADAAPEAEPAQHEAEPSVDEVTLTGDPGGDELDASLRPAPAALAFDEVDHEAPGLNDPVDAGPPTEAVAAVDLVQEPHSDDDDPFLTELRKAMADDEPLGPRDHEVSPQASPLFEDEERRGWRFGRR